MRTVIVERTIHAPIADVFDWLTDATNYTQVPVVRRITLLRPGDSALNGTGAVRIVVTPLLKLTEQILEYTPPTLMRYSIIRSTPPLRHEEGYISFEETESGTRVRWFTRYEVDSPFLPTLFTLLMHPVIGMGFHIVLRTAARELRQG